MSRKMFKMLLVSLMVISCVNLIMSCSQLQKEPTGASLATIATAAR